MKASPQTIFAKTKKVLDTYPQFHAILGMREVQRPLLTWQDIFEERNKMARIWVSSDQHYNHANIIPYCARPFASVDAMNKFMHDAVCRLVAPDDIVYNVGDFMLYGGTYDRLASEAWDMHRLLDMPGRHIFIMGNHDRGRSREPRLKEAILDAFGMQFRLVHHPAEAPKDGRYNLTGHVHGAWLEYRNEHGALCYNVGVDMHRFEPVLLETLAKYFRKLKEKA